MVSEGLGKRWISDPLFPVLYVSHSFRVLGFLEGKVMLSEASVSHFVQGGLPTGGLPPGGLQGGICIIGGGQTPQACPTPFCVILGGKGQLANCSCRDRTRVFT